MFSTWIILFFLGTGSRAVAGSWSSGGTELLGDARNPWFLPNTNHATYCILLDQQNTGITRSQASDLILKSIRFWSREFVFGVTSKFPDFGKMQFATQVWEEKTCIDTNDDSVDLKFQLGTLTQKQIDFIKTPSKFAAITVRTEYDQVQLKGKGFIYVSPVQGRLAYQGALEKPDFWSREDGKNLYNVLRHELGHVFGLPHTQSSGELMSEDFAESLPEIPADAFNQYFGLAIRKIYCYKSIPDQIKPNLVKEVFNIEDTTKPCLRFEFIHNILLTEDSELRVYSGSNSADPGTLIGKAALKLSTFSAHIKNFIWLTPQQKVFSPKDLSQPGSNPDRVLGLTLMKQAKTGVYLSLDGKTERILSFSFEQSSSEATGSYVLNNELWNSAF